MPNKEIIFHLPGAFLFFNGIRDLGLLYKEQPHYFRENVKIGSAYGSPMCIWNGGRIIHTYFPKDYLEFVQKEMEYVNIPVRLTFTNSLIEEQHLYDTTGNMLLEIFSKGNNEILCNTTILENYIRNKYQDKFKYMSSTTKRLNSMKKTNLELEKEEYSLVVLDYDFNKNFTYLESISHKEKCELLCNPVCHPKCTKRIKHYNEISLNQLEMSEPQFTCEDAFKPFWSAMQNPNFISIEDIYQKYVPMGFHNFKLEGRTTSIFDWVEIIVYYLIKDEYHLEIRDFLQKALLKEDNNE